MNIQFPRHRLPHPCYTGFGTYFLTICTFGRKKFFTEPRLIEILTPILHDQFASGQFSLDAYCFMPDHCHILAGSQSAACDLPQAVRAFKGVSTVHARKMGIEKLWQRDYYDHILRSGESLNSVAAYIFSNPVRAGLVENPADWPFSGSSVFEWKKLLSPIPSFIPPWKPLGGSTSL
jgi:putative transposase